jgi:hypothetical protein
MDIVDPYEGEVSYLVELVDDQLVVTITNTDFCGVQLTFGNIKFEDDLLKFDYDILNFVDITVEQSVQLQKVISKFILDIVCASLSEFKDE